MRKSMEIPKRMVVEKRNSRIELINHNINPLKPIIKNGKGRQKQKRC